MSLEQDSADVERNDEPDRGAVMSGLADVGSAEIDGRYAPRRSWANLSLSRDRYKTVIDEEGSLLYSILPPLNIEHGLLRLGFDQTVRFRVLSSSKPTGFEQGLPKPEAPIVESIQHYPHAELRLTSFPFTTSEEERFDVVQWRITASEDDIDVALWIELGDGREWRVDSEVPTDSAASIYTEASDAAVTRLGSQPQPLRVAAAFDFGRSSAFSTDPVTLNAGEWIDGTVTIPRSLSSAVLLTEFDRTAMLESTAATWSAGDLLGCFRGIPDPDVRELLVVSARSLRQMQEVDAGELEYKVGPSVYQDKYTLDGHFILEAERYLGHHSDADLALRTLFDKVDPDTGLPSLIPGHLKEPAVVMATAVRQAELGWGLDQLEIVWPRIMAIVEGLDALVDPKSPNVTPIAYADGGAAGMREESTTAVWWLHGLAAAKRAARYLGRDEESVHDVFTRLLELTEQKAKRERRTTDEGVPFWPMVGEAGGKHRFHTGVQSDVDPWFRIGPSTASYALAQAVYPGEVWPGDHWIVTEFLDFLESIEEENVPAGTGWLPHRSVWPYAGVMYAEAALYGRRIGQALRYFYAFANHASSTGGWREELAIRSTHGASIVGEMPHGWAAAEYVRLLRNLVVFEEGSDVHVLRAVPRAWFEEAGTLEMAATPTRFGEVSVRLEFDRDESWSLHVEAPGDGPADLGGCIVHLPTTGTQSHPIYVDGVRMAPGERTLTLGSGDTASIRRGTQ